MDEQPKQYKLELLFDSSQITLETLQERIASALGDTIPIIELTIVTTKSGQLLVSLQSALVIVDACHDKINGLATDSPETSFIRLTDEAGDDVRQMAYAILSRIEQDFRAFIHRAVIEVFGFGWWEAVISGRLHTRTEDVANKNKQAAPYLHRLELTQFEDLIEIITYETSDWPEEKPLSASDLLDLLVDCTSIAEAQAKLAGKIRKVSLWDRVFARYFTDVKQWEAVKKSIGFVIGERHKVMHHRPIRLGAIEALKTKQQAIQGLLDATKDVLSEQERAEIQQEVGEELPVQVERMRRQQEIRFTTPFPQHLAEMSQQMDEIVRMAERSMPSSSFLKLAGQVDEIARMVERGMPSSSFLKLAGQVDEIARMAERSMPSSSFLKLAGQVDEIVRMVERSMPSSSFLTLVGQMDEIVRKAQKHPRQRSTKRAKRGAEAAESTPTEPDEAAEEHRSNNDDTQAPTTLSPATSSEPKPDSDD